MPDTLERAQRAVRQARVPNATLLGRGCESSIHGSRGNMGTNSRDFADYAYPQSKSDLFAMFIERCRSLDCRSGSHSNGDHAESGCSLPCLRHSGDESWKKGSLPRLRILGERASTPSAVRSCRRARSLCGIVRQPPRGWFVWLRLVEGQSEKSTECRDLAVRRGSIRASSGTVR